MTLQPSPVQLLETTAPTGLGLRGTERLWRVTLHGKLIYESLRKVNADQVFARLDAALASQAQPEQPKQDSVHLTSDAVVRAATAQPAETDMTALSIEWTDDIGTRHWATPSHALEVLKLFYDEWPGGVDEFEAEKRAAKLGADNASLVSNEKEESVAALPEGWVAVPIEPTQAMLRAAADNHGAWCEPCESLYECGVIVEQGMTQADCDEFNAQILDDYAGTYRAMLAALPPPPVDQGDA